MHLEIDRHFDQILLHAHVWNWGPDWEIIRNIYRENPDAYSVLTPFAYAYMEEVIRTRTTEYGRIAFDEQFNNIKKRKVGMGLIKLAKEQNANDEEFLRDLESVQGYFEPAQPTDSGDNRHSVLHGFMHPRYWSQTSFETLIASIARLSRHANF